MTLPNDQRPTGDSGSAGNRDRRVRFLNHPEVRELPAAEENVGLAERRRQTILPGEDEGRARWAAAADMQQVPEPEGPIRALDPTLAATRRARIRAEALSRMQLLEDTSMPDDLAAAEAEYDEPEELYNEAGIPIEPFHLRAEREAGYFDAEGNYLEYRLDAEDTDAWLESLMDEHHQVRADPTLVARRQKAVAQGGGARPASLATEGTRTPAAGAGPPQAQRRKRAGAGAAAVATAAADAAAADAGADDEDDEGTDDEDGPYDMDILEDTGAVLEEDERAVYQKRVADLLQLGETPLDGLRRLGKLMHGEVGAAAAAAAAAAPAATAPAGAPATADAAATGATIRPAEEQGAAGGDRGGGGGGAGKSTAADPSADATAEGIINGGGGGGGADQRGTTGGGVGLMTAAHLSCGERQRLKKMRREQLAGPGAAPPSAPQPPPQGETEGTEGKPAEHNTLTQHPQQRPEDEDSRMADAASDGTAEAAQPAAKAGLEAEVDVEAAARRPGDAPPSPAARQSAADAAAAAAARRRPTSTHLSEEAQEARRQFDALTSYANLLLSAGMFNVYGSTREQLLRAAQRTLGVDVVRSLTVAGQRPVGQAAPPTKTAPKRAAAAPVPAPVTAAADGAGGGEANKQGAAGKRRRTSAEGAATEAAATGGPGRADGDDQPAAGGASAAVDGDVDMFGDGDDDGAAAAVAVGTTSRASDGTDPPSSGRPIDRQQDDTAPPVAWTAAPSGPEAQLSSLAEEPDGAACAAARAASGDAGPGPGSCAAADLGGGAPATHRSLIGFEMDPDSGYLYSSQLGYYYDTSTGLYGDANSGLWYRHVAGGGARDGGGGAAADDDGAAVPAPGELGAGVRFQLVTPAERPQEQPQRQD